LRTNINCATRDTPFHLVYGTYAILPPKIYLKSAWVVQFSEADPTFHLVYGTDAILPPKIYLKSAWVAQFSEADQDESRELDANLLEEKWNKALANVKRYPKSLKCHFNKSIVPRQLEISNLILKKDICTKDKHKFSSPWEGPFIVVDIGAPGAYVPAKVDGSILPNTWNIN
jgi:hypothetical protein